MEIIIKKTSVLSKDKKVTSNEKKQINIIEKLYRKYLSKKEVNLDIYNRRSLYFQFGERWL